MRARLLILASAIGSLGWGAVLPYQGEHGGQVGGTRGARRDAGPGTGN